MRCRPNRRRMAKRSRRRRRVKRRSRCRPSGRRHRRRRRRCRRRRWPHRQWWPSVRHPCRRWPLLRHRVSGNHRDSGHNRRRCRRRNRRTRGLRKQQRHWQRSIQLRQRRRGRPRRRRVAEAKTWRTRATFRSRTPPPRGASCHRHQLGSVRSRPPSPVLFCRSCCGKTLGVCWVKMLQINDSKTWQQGWRGRARWACRCPWSGRTSPASRSTAGHGAHRSVGRRSGS
mmetsp:Transcript_17067/g.46239  ORF Transcript_17067/g.46239 Transcript_17067/m.46239 type:complete len:228 (-) Transcript_17067:399-1082(-)